MKKFFIPIILMLIYLNLSGQTRDQFFPPAELTTVGVYYYPEHWDSTQWDRDIKKMAAMGFEFTHFAEFAWAQLEPAEGKYDFNWLDRAISLAAKYHLKVVLCTSTATPPVWLTRAHPEILVTNEDGTTGDHGSRQNASFSSNFYRQYAMKMIGELAGRYGKDDRVIGWQLDNEPRKFFDHGVDAHKRFREWLQKKYHTIDALNEAWGNNFWSGTYSDFSQVNIPKENLWGMNLHQRLDYSRFADDETSSFLDDQAKTIRKFSSPRQWVTSNYIPMYDVGYVGESKELDFVSYTRYMVYGGDQGIGPKRLPDRRILPHCYGQRFLPAFDRILRSHGITTRPGQLGQCEPPTLPGAVRFWLWHVFAGGSKFTCTYRFRAPIYGYEQVPCGIVGPDGVTPTPGGLEFSKFIDDIKMLRKNYDPGSRLPADYVKRKQASCSIRTMSWRST